jgi:glutamate racemase
MRIALFDSGIGGISVLTEAVRRLPKEDFLYVADTLHVPYGSKPKEQVKQHILDAMKLVMQEPVKAVVIACNTATSIAIEELRSSMDIPVIGMEPAVKPAVEISRSSGKRVLVLATPLTLRENKYNELVHRVDDMSIVDSLPLPELVEYCEALNFDPDEIKAYCRDKLSAYSLEQYGTVVLGCTHYPFYKRILAELLPVNTRLVDGSLGTVKRLRDILEQGSLLNEYGQGDVHFLCTSHDDAYIHKMKKAYQIFLAQIEEPSIPE